MLRKILFIRQHFSMVSHLLALSITIFFLPLYDSRPRFMSILFMFRAFKFGNFISSNSEGMIGDAIFNICHLHCFIDTAMVNLKIGLIIFSLLLDRYLQGFFVYSRVVWWGVIHLVQASTQYNTYYIAFRSNWNRNFFCR